jgi:hypothetical protein
MKVTPFISLEDDEPVGKQGEKRLGAILKKHGHSHPDLTLDDLRDELAVGMDYESEVHGWEADPERLALDCLSQAPDFYTGILLPTLKRKGV